MVLFSQLLVHHGKAVKLIHFLPVAAEIVGIVKIAQEEWIAFRHRRVSKSSAGIKRNGQRDRQDRLQQLPV